MDDPTPLDRRTFVLASLAAAGGAVASRLLRVPSLAAAATGPELVIRNPRPLAAEAPLEALQSWRTPNDLFFVRSHFGPPTTLPAHWTLTVDGEVGRPLTLSLTELRRLPGITLPVTLECAGNGRGLMALPSTSGVQWQRGAVGNAEWTGTRLTNVLERVALRPSAAHFWMEAADSGGAQVPKFLRSIPREVGLEDALVAYAMNGGPIPLHNGGPLRLLVPGWFGMASTKWLTHVHAMPVESDNFYMKNGYRYADGSGVAALRPKSVIAAPLADARVPAGRLAMRGQAWSGRGSGGIRGVDVSADGGRTWRAARLLGAERAGAWRTGEADVAVARGAAVLMARATDASGAAQPMEPVLNPGGFGNNAVHRVAIQVG